MFEGFSFAGQIGFAIIVAGSIGLIDLAGKIIGFLTSEGEFPV